MKKYKNKQCNNCNNTFEPNGAKQKYCSKECQFLGADKITTSLGCHEWVKNFWRGNYGKLGYNGKKYGAHRISCEISHGPAPIDKPFVLHACDNPKCVNPDHLRWGTHTENMIDVSDRHRQRGENNGSAKLTEKQAREIKYDTSHSTKELMAIYGRSQGCINEIKAGRNWKHI